MEVPPDQRKPSPHAFGQELITATGAKDGSLLVADDTAGPIWKIAYAGPISPGPATGAVRSNEPAVGETEGTHARQPGQQ